VALPLGPVRYAKSDPTSTRPEVVRRIETVQELLLVWTEGLKQRGGFAWRSNGHVRCCADLRECEDNFRRQSGATFVECLGASGNASIAARIAVTASPAQRRNRLARPAMDQLPPWFDPCAASTFCSAIPVILSLTDLAYV